MSLNRGKLKPKLDTLERHNSHKHIWIGDMTHIKVVEEVWCNYMSLMQFDCADVLR